MGKPSNGRSVIVVGAGVGGVSCAARLAKAGYKVTVVEKNGFTGGRCSLIRSKGFRFDQGPSLLLLPDMFRETFADLGTTMEREGVELIKCEPNYQIWFKDGESFELSTQMSVMKREIEKWEGKDGFERYLQFMTEAHRHYELSVTHVLRKNFTSMFSMARLSFILQVFSLHPFESIWSRASKYFWTERLRRVFTFGSMYMGMSPFDAPGTYSLLQYTELAEGIWYPVGGFHKVVEAIENIGRRLGVVYRLNTAVKEIIVDSKHKRATGVRLSDGTVIEADTVVVNADLVYAYNNLLPPSSQARSLSSRQASCSSFSFYWALDRVVPELRTHNIFLAEQYKESFNSIFKEQSLPTEPSFYVNVPSRVDPTAAPQGKDAIVVLVPCGHLLHDKSNSAESSTDGKGLQASSGQDWDKLIERARSTVIDTIERRTGVSNFASYISEEITNTPVTWKEIFNLDKGAILGLSHSFFNVLSFRPKTKHPSYDGLYFVGASTHPGTGVPIVMAGAKLTATQVLKNDNLPAPWRFAAGSSASKTNHLDRMETPSWIHNQYAILAIIIVCLIFNQFIL